MDGSASDRDNPAAFLNPFQIPRLVESLMAHQCSQVAAAKDHTLVLTEDGCVYTFGLNTFHQLGVLPPPPNCSVPRQVIQTFHKIDSFWYACVYMCVHVMRIYTQPSTHISMPGTVQHHYVEPIAFC